MEEGCNRFLDTLRAVGGRSGGGEVGDEHGGGAAGFGGIGEEEGSEALDDDVVVEFGDLRDAGGIDGEAGATGRAGGRERGGFVGV